MGKSTPVGMPAASPDDPPGVAGRVVALLLEAADLLEAFGENPHRVRAYRQGAESLRRHAGELARRVAEDTLTELPGIGPELAAKAAEIVAGGRLAGLEALRARVPPETALLTQVPGVDPKTAIYLASRLHVHTVAHLRALARTHLLRSVPWLGAEGARRIDRGLAERSGA
jgi:DNA polymerase (family 10)